MMDGSSRSIDEAEVHFLTGPLHHVLELPHVGNGIVVGDGAGLEDALIGPPLRGLGEGGLEDEGERGECGDGFPPLRGAQDLEKISFHGLVLFGRVEIDEQRPAQGSPPA